MVEGEERLVTEFREDEPTRVHDWRLEMLLCAGYRLADAEAIAARIEIDLHRAVDLVAAGCPHELAAAILT